MKSTITFFKGVIDEIKLTQWLSLNTTINYTLLVIVLTIALGLFVAAADFVFFKLRDLLFSLIK